MTWAAAGGVALAAGYVYLALLVYRQARPRTRRRRKLSARVEKSLMRWTRAGRWSYHAKNHT